VIIQIVTPAPPNARNGNRMTALRWARLLRRQGHRVRIKQLYDGRACDLLIALHALRSHESIRRYREKRPGAPLVVVLTGTDLYRDIRKNSRARESLELATRLVVLQKKAREELPPRLRRRTRVIYQSAERLRGAPPKADTTFKVCVVGHLRREKDPMRTAMAVRLLPLSSRINVLHIGRALTREMQRRASRESARNERYTWLGPLPHGRTRRVMARCHLVSLTSRMEGSSNVLSEAIASSVPVVASKIPGLMGTLGNGYPGYFPVGNARALARLLARAEASRRFYLKLKRACARLAPLVEPASESRSLSRLLGELPGR